MEGEKEVNNSRLQKHIPISRNSDYAAAGGGNGHIISSTTFPPPSISNAPTSSSVLEDQRPYKKAVRYKECLKNHAAAIGGNATDGCGEFMPSGEQGTLEALKCSACSCHRNFHRKEVDGECSYDFYNSPILTNNPGGRLILGHHIGSLQGYPIKSFLSSRPPPAHQMIVSYRSGSVPSVSDEKDDDHKGDGNGAVAIIPVEKPKKRFRTKFTEEQKQKMVNFAEKAGWKMQKLEESAVQRFCQEVGIKRRVLKVWMHNNKHQFAKKNPTTS